MEKDTATKIAGEIRIVVSALDRVADIARNELSEAEKPTIFVSIGEIFAILSDKMKAVLLKQYPELKQDVFGQRNIGSDDE
ncbi:MAG: hypothetical protein AAFV45_03060 [Pseudomonadota bacterium]